MKRAGQQGGRAWRRLIVLTLLWLAPCIGASRAYPQAMDQKLLTETIRVAGKSIHTWPEEGMARCFEVMGDSRIQQGDITLASTNAVIWFDELAARTSGVAQCFIYAESGVTLVHEGKTEAYQQLLAQFDTQAGLTVDGPIMTYESPLKNALYKRAVAVRDSQKPGFTSTRAIPAEAKAKAKPRGAAEAEAEEVEIFAENMNSWEEGDKRVVVATGNVVIRRGAYELTAERVVLWVPAASQKGGNIQELGQVYAEGDVTLSNEKGLIRADQVFADRIANRSLMTNAEVRTTDPSQKIPFVFRGEEVRQLDEQRFVAKNGSITTDPYGKPHFKFKGKVMKLTLGKRASVVSSTDNTLQIGDVPVARWPFFSKDMRDDSWMLKNINMGWSNAYGPSVQTEWDLYDMGMYRNDWSDATFQLDGFGTRGVGIGPTFAYEGDKGYGFVRGYYLHDSAEYDRSRLRIETADRGRLQWEHREYLPMDWRFDTEASFLSDRGFLDEFKRDEFAEGTPQETFQYFRKLQDNAAMTLLFQEKINDFDPMTFKPEGTSPDFTPPQLSEIQSQNFDVDSYLESPLYDSTLQKFPELGYHQIGQPLFGSLLSYSTDTRFDAVSQQYDSELLRKFPDLPLGYPTQFETQHGDAFLPLANPATTARLDTRHDLSMPFDIGPVRVEPMFSTRIQAESSSAGLKADPITGDLQAVDNGATARALAGPQITASANFWRVYDVHNALFDVNRLKHIITPLLRYEDSAVVTESSDRLNNFDPYSTVQRVQDTSVFQDYHLVPVVSLPSSFNDFSRVESMDHMQRIVAELRQRLQTKRGSPGYEETVDLAELRVAYTAFPGNAGLNQQFKEVYGDFFRADLFWKVRKDIVLESWDNEWNTSNSQVETANIGVNFLLPPDWNLYVGQRYIRDARETEQATGNLEEVLYGRAATNMTLFGLEYTISPKYAVTVVEQFDWSTHQNPATKVILSRKVPGWVIDFVADVGNNNNDKLVGIQLTPLGLSRGQRRFW